MRTAKVILLLASCALAVVFLALASGNHSTVRLVQAGACDSPPVSGASAVSIAETRASQVGFAVSSTESYSALTPMELWEEEHLDLMDDPSCVWWVVLLGSKTQDKMPPEPAGTPTLAPVAYVKMGVGIDAVSGYVVAQRFTGNQVGATHTPTATNTSGPAPTATDTPAPFPTPTTS